MPFMVQLRHRRPGSKAVKNLITFITMKEILQAVLTDASVRTADTIEMLAVEQAEFLTWD
jgi:hypothetical protein